MATDFVIKVDDNLMAPLESHLQRPTISLAVKIEVSSSHEPVE